MTGQIKPSGNELTAVTDRVMANRGGVLDRFEAVVKWSGNQIENLEEMSTHHFIPGFYCRQTSVPAGVMFTSKIHLTDHAYHMTQGRLFLFNEASGEKVEVVAPAIGITKAGTRRLVYVAEDVIWTTFHATDKTDVDEIEKEIILSYEPEPFQIPTFAPELLK